VQSVSIEYLCLKRFYWYTLNRHMYLFIECISHIKQYTRISGDILVLLDLLSLNTKRSVGLLEELRVLLVGGLLEHCLLPQVRG